MTQRSEHNERGEPAEQNMHNKHSTRSELQTQSERASEYAAQSDRYKKIMIMSYIVTGICFALWLFYFIAIGPFNPIFMIPASFGFIAFAVIGGLARQKYIKYRSEASDFDGE